MDRRAAVVGGCYGPRHQLDLVKEAEVSGPGGFDLEDGAALATIVGTIVTVTAAVLAWLGKWRFRLPAGLVSLEVRTLFVISVAIVALPIIAWGPLGGLVPALANVVILPSFPGYLDRWLKRPLSRRHVGVAQGLVFTLVVLLCLMNIGALLSMFPWRPVGHSLASAGRGVGSFFSSSGGPTYSYEVVKRINDAKDCGTLDREFELALKNYRQAEAAKDLGRMDTERYYMLTARGRMRDLSCVESSEVQVPAAAAKSP
jgi:hypothetical protein